MSHVAERCPMSCPRLYPHRPERWCHDCQVELEQWNEEQSELAVLGLTHQLANVFVPATDAEWLSWLDQHEPLVLEAAQGPMPGDEPEKGWHSYAI